MCGRFSLLAGPEHLAEHFQLRRPRPYQTRYNIAPGQKILTIVRLDDGAHKAVNLWWGLVPSWAKDRKIGSRMINARAETVGEKPAFRSAYRKRRCLIPATGFYEWKKTDHGKQAYHIGREDRGLFAFAGLWEYWEQGAETLYSCTIITRSAGTLMRPIHPRMPVVIACRHYPLWLDRGAILGDLNALLTEDAYHGFAVKPVSDWVNNPAHDDEKCLD